MIRTITDGTCNLRCLQDYLPGLTTRSDNAGPFNFFLTVIALVSSQEVFLKFKVRIILALKLKNFFKSIWLKKKQFNLEIVRRIEDKIK